ncbi:hypothetical protein COCSADRAFT_353736, partial [Bipolaris sorokiniana ND90Pr]
IPKVQKPYTPHTQTLTKQKRAHTAQAEEKSLKIDFRYKRYKEKKLYYFVKTSSGRYTRCISVSAKCSLFISKKE